MSEAELNFQELNGHTIEKITVAKLEISGRHQLRIKTDKGYLVVTADDIYGNGFTSKVPDFEFCTYPRLTTTK